MNELESWSVSCCFRLSATWATTPAPALWNHSFLTCLQTMKLASPKVNKILSTQMKQKALRNRNWRYSTWILLWAKNGQIAEWKLTSTFFHPNCCKPRIISSVEKVKTHVSVCYWKQMEINTWISKEFIPNESESWETRDSSTLTVFRLSIWRLKM